MAGSSTQSMENFTAQGMGRHQIMMNTEMMKQMRIMNRASVREIMLQHEKTFKEQVHDLHKLYEVQKVLMDKAKSRGRDAAGMPPASPGRGNIISEETNKGQRSNFWEQVTPVTPDGMGIVKGGTGSSPKTILDRNIKLQETPKSVNSPVRKRKIDLEQLPEDDSDDEVQNSADTLNPTSSSLSGNSRELPKVYSGFQTPVKPSPGPHVPQVSSGLQPLQPIKHLQASSFLSGESSSYMEADGSRGDSSYPPHHGKGPPSLPLNVIKTEQTFTMERNKPFQNASMMTGASINNTMFLPQADLIDRASQDTGKQAHWFFPATEGNAANPSTRFPGQQQQRLSSHLGPPEHSSSKGHPPPLNLDQIHLNKSPFESAGGIFGKASLDSRHSPGLTTAAQKDVCGASTERLGDPSKWFTKESSSQGSLGNVVPMTRFETGSLAEGGHSVPGIITPPITAASNKGSSQEREVGLWPSQNPILQLPKYQQPPVFQQQALPPVSQALWVPAPQNAQNSMYSQQQIIYGLHASDPSQIGYPGDVMQRNQGEIAGPWNVIGLGHYYSNLASTPQKPPFKKPPKLVLKNDGVGMELKLVSPEDSTEKERGNQKKPVNVLKRDTVQAASKSSDNKNFVEDNHKLDTQTASEALITGSTMQAKEQSKKVGAPIEPKLLITASSSSTLTPLQGASTPTMLPSAVHCNVGALASTSGSDIGSGFHVSTSPSEGILQQCVAHLETVFPSPEQDKMAEQRTSGLKSVGAAFEKETLPLTNSSAGKGMQSQPEESRFSKGELDVNSGFCTTDNIKEPLDKMLMPEDTGIDVMASQSESFTIPQGFQSEYLDDGVTAGDVLQPKLQKLNEVKGSPLQQCANSPVKDFSENKTSRNANLAGSTSQPGMQPVSVQSASTDTPSTSRQENKRLSDNDLSYRVTGRSHSECNNESESPHSDKQCVPAASLTTFLSESKSEAMVDVSHEDIQHDSDTDNLAATILLSFAPKLDLLREEKQCKDNASEMSSSIHKVRPADQGRKTSRCTEASTGSQSDNWNAGSTQGRSMQGPISSRRIDTMDHYHHHHIDNMKAKIKDRHKRECMNSAERQTDEGDVVTKGLTFKLPRMTSSTLSDEAIPISRSKHLNKLNGATFSGSPGESAKNSQKSHEAVHTPTGRRSSRGPPMAARAPQESRSRLNQQTQHGLEYSPPPLEKDSGVREGGGRSGNKLEGNVKSKAWGELNRTRSSHSRKQFHELSHRKSQK